jgi:hypothetical protein
VYVVLAAWLLKIVEVAARQKATLALA